MRSYAKNFSYRKTTSYKERQERSATEWDIRLDVSDALTVNNIISNIKESLDDVLYVLVSGVERPDPDNGMSVGFTRQSGATSKEDHVHIALVLHVPEKRARVLKLVRGPRKMGDEYCAPRNPKFTYAGWVIHHTKEDYKVCGEPAQHYEYGTLPQDPFTTDAALKIIAMLKKHGSDTTRRRFKIYVDLMEKNKIQEKMDKLELKLFDLV